MFTRIGTRDNVEYNSSTIKDLKMQNIMIIFYQIVFWIRVLVQRNQQGLFQLRSLGKL
ncbi:hypothetical protein IHE45_16G053600 [Dioscorea alata]|uniref:Uncharacterized protein n=1 Tax=Dioscorea alata TaxID=55571 RepID=A0ACB7UHM1_DIOAL|nr:hypothetical protein IHE45_16G053600 [Dioscorea alata]